MAIAQEKLKEQLTLVESVIKDNWKATRQQYALATLASSQESTPERYIDAFENIQNKILSVRGIKDPATDNIESALGDHLNIVLGQTITGWDHKLYPSIELIADDVQANFKAGKNILFDLSEIIPAQAIKVDAHVLYGLDATLRTLESRVGIPMDQFNYALRIDHPELEQFLALTRLIPEKRLFIKITDRFMRALSHDDNFTLIHEEEPQRSFTATQNNQHIYQSKKAQHFWEELMLMAKTRNNLFFVFDDRAQEANSLFYVEGIGSIHPEMGIVTANHGVMQGADFDLSAFVRNAGKQNARLDTRSLFQHVRLAVRMLDNLVDATEWVSLADEADAECARRLALNLVGIGDTMTKLGLDPTDDAHRAYLRHIIKSIREAAYQTSVDLAQEKGCFAYFIADHFLAAASVSQLPNPLRDDIVNFGIRNSQLITMSPFSILPSQLEADADIKRFEPLLNLIQEVDALVMTDNRVHEKLTAWNLARWYFLIWNIQRATAATNKVHLV